MQRRHRYRGTLAEQARAQRLPKMRDRCGVGFFAQQSSIRLEGRSSLRTALLITPFAFGPAATLIVRLTLESRSVGTTTGVQFDLRMTPIQIRTGAKTAFATTCSLVLERAGFHRRPTGGGTPRSDRPGTSETGARSTPGGAMFGNLVRWLNP